MTLGRGRIEITDLESLRSQSAARRRLTRDRDRRLSRSVISIRPRPNVT